jgi:type III pantothenate kinase
MALPGNYGMNVCIDLGNSLAKVGIFDHHDFKELHVFGKVEEVISFVKNFSGENIIIGSVNSEADMLQGAARHFRRSIVLTSSTPLPIENHYSTPETLGVDRIAAVCGAHQLFPGQNCLVIDAGTCVTFELVDAEGRYWGGAISPGLSMRFKAMSTFTARLPLVEPREDVALTGDSTVSCMQSGVIIGMIDEIEGAIRRYSEKFEDLRVILTGGDSRFFENKLKASIFASPELVLRGLNSVLLYNIRG